MFFFPVFLGLWDEFLQFLPRFFLANHPFSQVTACIEKTMTGCLHVGCFGFIQGNVSGKCLCMSHLPLAFIDSCQARSCNDGTLVVLWLLTLYFGEKKTCFHQRSHASNSIFPLLALVFRAVVGGIKTLSFNVFNTHDAISGMASSHPK